MRFFDREQEFEKLPPILQRLAGSPEQIKAWAMMDIDELQTVVSSNLMRSYRVIAKNEEVRQSLPTNIQNMLESAANTLRLE